MNISDQIYLSAGLPLDSRLSNTKIVGSEMIIETISEYLARVSIYSRSLGEDITIITPPGTLSLATIVEDIKLHPFKKYRFTGGIEDSNLIEVLLEAPLTFSSGLSRSANAVTNTDKGSTAVSTHEGSFVHGDIAHTNRTALNAVTNVNTGDETQSTIKTKLGAATDSVDGYLTAADHTTFNAKQPAGSYEVTTNKENTTLDTSTTKYPTNRLTKEYADGKVADAIADNVTTVAPSQNAVFDALSLKQNSIPFVIQSDNKFLRDDNTFQLIEPPSGGYANNLYFSETASSVPGYETLTYVPDMTTTIESHTVRESDGEKLLHTYLYPTGVSVTNIPSGLWSFNYYGLVSSSAGITQLGITYFARHIDNSETDLFTIWSEEINNTTDLWIKFNSTQPNFTVVETDRMGARTKIRTTRTTDVTVTYTVGDGYGAFMNNPNKIRHSQLRDLNGDTNFLHITSTQASSWDSKAPGSGSANYIQNQNAAAQATSNLWISGSAKAGTAVLGTPSDNTTIEADGTIKFNGAATVFEDVKFDALTLLATGPGISINTAESSVDYTAAANNLDYLMASPQLPHAYRSGSTIQPHIHFTQAQNNIPNFALQYRWQINGGTKTTAWTAIKCNIPAFTYTSGSINQIAKTAAGVTPPVGYNISDIIQFRVIRDTSNALGLAYAADPYTATVGVISFDCHVELDGVGSRSEYTK